MLGYYPEEFLERLERSIDTPSGIKKWIGIARGWIRRLRDEAAEPSRSIKEWLAAAMAWAKGVFKAKEKECRSVGEWIGLVKGAVTTKLDTPDDIYLSLPLVSAEFAREFTLARPQASGFDRACKQFTDRLTHEEKERWDQLVGRTPTLMDRRRHPAMARAIDSCEAEFALLAEARSFQQSKFFPGKEAANQTYSRFYLPLRHAFEDAHGRITMEYWCDDIPLGVVLTTGGRGGKRLHFDGVYDANVGAVISRCKEIHEKARRFLPPPEYRTVVGELYEVLTELFHEMDSVAVLEDGNSTYELDSAPYLKRAKKIETGITKGVARRGQRWYIAGTTLGLLLLSAMFGLLALLFNLGDWQQIFKGAIFGAGGALASVLYRMHRGELSVDAQQGWLLVSIAASVRPLTGALFGGAIVALLLSGLPQIEVPKTDPDRFYFLGVFAFLAGLSERWAPDLLQLTADQITSKAEPEKKEEEKGTAAANGTTVSE